jgi:membrane-associated phospholipid phosphatase
MRAIRAHVPAYEALTLSWMLALLLWVALSGYTGSFLQLHSWRMAWGDAFFPHFTHLGDGLLAASLGMLLLSGRRQPEALLLPFALLLLGLLIGLGKQLLFPDWGRPALVLGEERIHLISLGKERHFAFPSGHTAVAVALGFFLSRGQGAWAGLGWGLWAMAVAYSRVYIGVHFPADLVSGGAVGWFSAWAVWSGGQVKARQRVARWPTWGASALRGSALLLLGSSILLIYFTYYR